jgi:hypothetical protein
MLPHSCSLALRMHQEALAAQLEFWRCLLRKQVPLQELTRLVHQLGVSVRRAERVYKCGTCCACIWCTKTVTLH